jgi:isoleucyl-tRNA synthetase
VTWLAPMLCFTAEEAWLARDPAARPFISNVSGRAAVVAR